MNPEVSILCITYNQSKYIRKCLDGMLMQQTSFPFEILIHDDMSTDGTAEILKEYEQKYPDVVRVMPETENQYSKGNRCLFMLLCPMIRGRYVAMCEGDDYWTDVQKLQKQYDAMEAHPECTMCLHRVQGVNEDETPNGKAFPQNGFQKGVVAPEPFLRAVCESYSFQTTAYFYRAADLKGLTDPVPEFRKTTPAGDEAYLLYFGQLGPVYFVDETMSCYRMNSVGSWSERYKNTAKEKKSHREKMIRTMEQYDAYTDYRFHEICQRRIDHFRYTVAADEGDFRTLVQKQYRPWFREENIKFRLKARVKAMLGRGKKPEEKKQSN